MRSDGPDVALSGAAVDSSYRRDRRKWRKDMKTRLLAVLCAPLVALGLAACDVDKTEEGELPEVEVEGGKLPEYDVDAAEVEVGTDTQRVVVPDVDIKDPDDTTSNR
jgi:hypothetical protein